MGLLFLSSVACCLERFLEPQLTSTVGSSRALNIHCALSALNIHLLRADAAVRASQHALFLDGPLFFFLSTPHSIQQYHTTAQRDKSPGDTYTELLHCIQQKFSGKIRQTLSGCWVQKHLIILVSNSMHLILCASFKASSTKNIDIWLMSTASIADHNHLADTSTSFPSILAEPGTSTPPQSSTVQRPSHRYFSASSPCTRDLQTLAPSGPSIRPASTLTTARLPLLAHSMLDACVSHLDSLQAGRRALLRNHLWQPPPVRKENLLKGPGVCAC